MPKRVDHDERRGQIVEALWRLTLDRGLTAVSFREVAAEAGVSVRQVQYYFGTKAELLLASVRLIGARVVGRGMEGIAAAGPNPTPRDLVRAAIAGALPLDDQQRTDALLFMTFYIAALTDPTLAGAETLSAPRASVEGIVEMLRQAHAAGRTRAGVDPELDGQLIVALNTGLIVGVLAGMLTGEQALEAIDHQLDRLFKGDRR
jgi:AcrR family transcriptional regulator